MPELVKRGHYLDVKNKLWYKKKKKSDGKYKVFAFNKWQWEDAIDVNENDLYGLNKNYN